MIKQSKWVKGVIIVTTFGFFIAITSFTSSANAATVKNGVACKKLGQKTKSGIKTYYCEKNPYVTPTKNTWTLATCLDSYDVFIDSKDQYGIFKDILSASPEGVTELGNLQKSIDSLVVLMKTKTCKKGA